MFSCELAGMGRRRGSGCFMLLFVCWTLVDAKSVSALNGEGTVTWLLSFLFVHSEPRVGDGVFFSGLMRPNFVCKCRPCVNRVW